jgi:virulence factor Mce-like protein
MKRLTAGLASFLAAFAIVFAILGARADSASTYRVDALFDTAKGVIPGQLVKIAGARVGKIDDVQLTSDYKARIIMEVPSRFTFREDASCNIQPEGLISENFVQCDPGTPSKGELRGVGDSQTPTVPVERTSVPVSITDLFRIFQADIRQRFTVAVAAVGGGLAARGDDINDIIRRANPTLGAVRKLTRDLAAQKDQLSQAVRDTDAVVTALAERSDGLQAFIEQSQRLTSQTADHSSALAEGIQRLPNLLDKTDVTIADLNTLTREGRPLLGRLRAAAPGLERVVDQLAPFAAIARPTLDDLSNTSDIGRNTVKAARPLIPLLRRFAQHAGPTGRLLNALLVNLRDRGFVESLNLFGYYAAAAVSRYDTTSHIFPAHTVLSSCSQYAETPDPDCTTFYGSPRGSRSTSRVRSTTPQLGTETPADATATPAPADAAPGAPAPQKVPPLLAPVQELTQQLQEDLGKVLPPGLQQLLQGKGGPPNQQALDDLADYLFRP